MNLDEAFDRLEALAKEPRMSGGHIYALCPSHDDTEPSLSISEGDTVELLITCFAGCSFGDVIAALNGSGIVMPDRARLAKARKRSPFELVPEARYDYATADDTVTLCKHRGQIVDAITREVKRAKAFKWTHSRAGGPDLATTDGYVPRLYRHDQISAANESGRALYLTEGEKDADAIIAASEPAVSVAHGAGKWLPSWTDELAELTVPLIICADNDEPGRRHAEMVLAELTK